MIGTVVGVLRGGPSKEHDVSLKTGHAILKHLPKDTFTARDIFIDKTGQWHVNGKPATPTRALASVDAVIIGLHGEYGEDGQVQRILEQHGVPYTGSGPFSSHRAMHKLMAKHKAEELGVKTPRYRYIDEKTDLPLALADVIRSFQLPVVVKPVGWGSSVGVSLVSAYAPLYEAVTTLLEAGAGGVLIEERIQGEEATVGIIEGLRGETLYALPSVQIIRSSNREVCPGNFTTKEKEELARLSRLMHEALELRHYSRSGFIVSPQGMFYIETNTLPELANESLLQKSLAAVGVPFPDFLKHITDLAMAGV